MAMKNEYCAPERSGSIYHPPARRQVVVDEVGPLVGDHESDEKLWEEFKGLDHEGRVSVREEIRLRHLILNGIDKRRLLSDPIMGGGDPQPPGDKLVADLLIEMNRREESFQRKWRRKAREFLDEHDQERYNIRTGFKNRLDTVEGWFDPDRIEKRRKARIDREAKEKSAQVAGSGQ